MLTINISELLLTVLSFFILMFLLNKLLFKPVISFRSRDKRASTTALSKSARPKRNWPRPKKIWTAAEAKA